MDERVGGFLGVCVIEALGEVAQQLAEGLLLRRQVHGGRVERWREVEERCGERAVSASVKVLSTTLEADC